MRRLLLASLALCAAGSGARAQPVLAPPAAQPPAVEIPDAPPPPVEPPDAPPPLPPDLVGVPGPLLTAEIVQSFTADSNYGLDDPRPGASYYADTRLILGLVNETPTQLFALGFDTGLRALWEAEEDFDLTFASPSTASLDYNREWATGLLETTLSYRRRDVDSTDVIFEDDIATPGIDDLREVEEDAVEGRLDGGIDLALATDSPSSYELSFAGTRIDYDEESDDLTPRTSLDGDALWILELNPVVSGTIGAGYAYFDAENAVETQIRQGEVSFGVIYAPSELLELSLGLGYANYTREQLVDDRRTTVDDDSGFVLDAGVEYLFDDITVTAEARLTNAAPETRLSGAVVAVYPLPDGAVRGRIYQRYGGGETGQEVRVTGATIGLTHEINEVSGVALDFAVAQQENLDTDEEDVERFDVTATYSYALTEVVNASVGYRFRSRDQTPDSATSNAVFVEIGRVFETRP